MVKKDFIIGENIIVEIYKYDDQGKEYIKKVKGKVIQATNDFVVIDNGKYKESFKYCEFNKSTPYSLDNEPYDLSLEVYEEDVINQCFENFCKGKEGYVFNQRQLNKVLEKIGSIPCSHYEKDSIFYVKKV